MRQNGNRAALFLSLLILPSALYCGSHPVQIFSCTKSIRLRGSNRNRAPAERTGRSICMASTHQIPSLAHWRRKPIRRYLPSPISSEWALRMMSSGQAYEKADLRGKSSSDTTWFACDSERSDLAKQPLQPKHRPIDSYALRNQSIVSSLEFGVFSLSSNVLLLTNTAAMNLLRMQR